MLNWQQVRKRELKMNVSKRLETWFKNTKQIILQISHLQGKSAIKESERDSSAIIQWQWVPEKKCLWTISAISLMSSKSLETTRHSNISRKSWERLAPYLFAITIIEDLKPSSCATSATLVSVISRRQPNVPIKIGLTTHAACAKAAIWVSILSL